MEDELKIRAGNANGTDILDREVAQAGRGSCGHSNTFSGRWGQDSTSGNDNSTDNEGTYVAVIDGRYGRSLLHGAIPGLTSSASTSTTGTTSRTRSSSGFTRWPISTPGPISPSASA